MWPFTSSPQTTLALSEEIKRGSKHTIKLLRWLLLSVKKCSSIGHEKIKSRLFTKAQPFSHLPDHKWQEALI